MNDLSVWLRIKPEASGIIGFRAFARSWNQATARYINNFLRSL